MSEIHNGELTQDVILGAVAAWLEQTNDSQISIEVGFQRDLTRRNNFDLIAETKVTVLKPQDYRPAKRMGQRINEDDQKLMDLIELRKWTPEEEKEQRENEMRRDASKNKSAEDSERRKMTPSREGIWSDEVVKFKAVNRELPSAEYYPVKFIEGVSRTLNRRSSTSELDTAQEAPAVREKGDANDRTDQDCRTLPTDLASSKESLAAEAPTQVEKSPPLEREDKTVSPVKPIPEKKEEKVEEKVVEKVIEKVEKKEEPVKEVVMEKEKPAEAEVPKPIALKPVVKRSKRSHQINMKRRPDTGELKILSETNGIVTFTCSTKHRVKKNKSKSKSSSSKSKSTLKSESEPDLDDKQSGSTQQNTEFS